jgi:hypothetical protein
LRVAATTEASGTWRCYKAYGKSLRQKTVLMYKVCRTQDEEGEDEETGGVRRRKDKGNVKQKRK